MLVGYRNNEMRDTLRKVAGKTADTFRRSPIG